MKFWDFIHCYVHTTACAYVIPKLYTFLMQSFSLSSRFISKYLRRVSTLMLCWNIKIDLICSSPHFLFPNKGVRLTMSFFQSVSPSLHFWVLNYEVTLNAFNSLQCPPSQYPRHCCVLEIIFKKWWFLLRKRDVACTCVCVHVCVIRKYSLRSYDSIN